MNILIPGIGNLMDVVEGGHQTIYRSKSCKCKRYTFRGVRGRDVDILIDERVQSWSGCVRLECSEKSGRYDGAVRHRYVFRIPERSDQHEYVFGTIPEFVLMPGSIVFRVAIPGTEKYPVDHDYRRLVSDIDRSNELSLVRMLTTHAFGSNDRGGYFRHLDADTVDSCAAEFVAQVIEHPTWTKAEAYQCAGRILYRESRNLGFRKLTLREKKKLGIDPNTGQWWKEERIHSITGCGEATLSGKFE